ncbi:MAG TPA: SRPBCC family protein [Candidatus Limnocylindria bacterium]|nr:SRPBCC family protein [Candidatus Limnocylindria bacterium]
MAKIERSIEVNVPLRTAYDQWTQFEEFPEFMEAVSRVEQVDDTTLEWTAEIAGRERTWTAEIYEQEPDRVIAWRSTTGARNSGRVTFEELGDATTRVMVTMEWEPDGAIEKAGEALGFDDRQVEGDLQSFKEFIEARGTETGAWRGEIVGGVERSS